MKRHQAALQASDRVAEEYNAIAHYCTREFHDELTTQDVSEKNSQSLPSQRWCPRHHSLLPLYRHDGKLSSEP